MKHGKNQQISIMWWGRISAPDFDFPHDCSGIRRSYDQVLMGFKKDDYSIYEMLLSSRRSAVPPTKLRPKRKVHVFPAKYLGRSADSTFERDVTYCCI